MIKKNRLTLFLLAGLFLIGAVLAAGAYSAVKGNAIAREGELFLRQGVTYEALLDSLAGGSVEVKSVRRFDRVARWVKADEQVYPGHYCLRRGTSYLQLARTFRQGWQTPVRVTYPSVRTLPALAGRIAGRVEADSLTLVRAFLSDTMAARYGFTKETFPGMFVPNTYEMYWTVTPQAFLDRMKREYDAFWTPEREKKRETSGLTRNEVSTLASIVGEETAKADEMPRVAGVYLNRLRTGMALQADPTLKFAAGDFSLKRILNAHKEIDSPYNTYRYAGLPPGPITVPSSTALDAVLNAERHNYLYFCAKADFSGYHDFARTFAEHNRNAARYHAALNRLGIR